MHCFEGFYRQARRRFRYGSVDGSLWQAANGLAQGCPASPDLLNILLEAFHRWAAHQELGILVAGISIASVSFADDVALVAGAQGDMEALIGAYLEWCRLLGLQVTKVQAWCSKGPGHSLAVGSSEISTTSNFRFVGIEVGLPDPQGSDAQFAPRLAKALSTTQRLKTLPLPSSICSLLWRTTVLPQALYGCEVRDIRPKELVPLASAGKAAIVAKAPLFLNDWRASDVAMGLPLGESAIQDPLAVARLRQLTWAQLLPNLLGLVGIVHRAIALVDGIWAEPSAALQSALRSLGWQFRVNLQCCRAQQWPLLQSEPFFF